MPYTIGIGTHVQRPYSLCSRVGVRAFLTVGCQKHGRGHILRCISMGYRCERECLRTLRHSDELTGTFVSGWQGAKNNVQQIPRASCHKKRASFRRLSTGQSATYVASPMRETFLAKPYFDSQYRPDW